MGFLSREIVRRVAPLVVAGAAGAAGAVLVQRRVSERRKLSLLSGPRAEQPVPAPPPPDPLPDPSPSPVPDPTPVPDPAPLPPPEPIPSPPSAGVEDALEGTVRSALAASVSDAGGSVEIELAGRMVVLRGRVDSPETIRELERTAASVPGVEGVRVLLHLPGRMAKRSR
jgi:hypothetical protein